MMSHAPAIPEFLARDDDGHIRFAGHRVGLQHVVRQYNDGESPESLHDHFPTLSLPLIHRAIAFYLEHRPELDSLFAADAAEVDASAGEPAKGPQASTLRARFEAMRRRESL